MRPWTLGQVQVVADALGPRYAVLPFLGAGVGPRQGEMFGLAVDDIGFLRRVTHLRRQVRLLGTPSRRYPGHPRQRHACPEAHSGVGLVLAGRQHRCGGVMARQDNADCARDVRASDAR